MTGSQDIQNGRILSGQPVYIIQQTVEAGSKRYGITTKRDTEDHYLLIIQLAVF
jgi:hypothetical protein